MHYYFHTADGSRDRDEEGMDLPDHNAARRQAITYAGECMHYEPDILANRDFRVEVTDADDKLLFTVITLAIDAPAAEARSVK